MPDTYQVKIVGSAYIDKSLDDTKDYSVAFKRLGIKIRT
jgi:hypothetical protein